MGDVQAIDCSLKQLNVKSSFTFFCYFHLKICHLKGLFDKLTMHKGCRDCCLYLDFAAGQEADFG